MTLRLAFIGFRHGHILSLYNAARGHEAIEVVAASEADADTRASIREQGKVELTHEDPAELLDQVECDAIAIGDCYGRRGEIATAALERGRHVILDKPVCTSMEELDQIEALARQKGLSVGCQLDLRDNAYCRTARRLIGEGLIGDVHTLTFLAQHPLMYGKRPSWYFEPGMHGGTVNDIGIHAFDLIGWMTGHEIAEVVAARAWNPTLPEVPHFQAGAQIMLRLDHGGGVLGDLSYLAPERCGYQAEQYWRFTVHGSGGVLEFSVGADSMLRITHQDEGPVPIQPDDGRSHGYLEDFLCEATGRPVGAGGLTTERVLAASRWSLLAQQHADAGQVSAVQS